MEDRHFWKIIDRSLAADQGERIRDILSGMPPKELLAFDGILNRQMAAACTFPLLAANFVIESYVSDDGFRAFRAWLVSQGQDRFLKAVLNPESIADWLDREDVDAINGGLKLTAAQQAWTEMHGKEQEFLRLASFEPDPEIEQEWPRNKAEFRRKFPKLVDKFWNQERIREMHTDD